MRHLPSLCLLLLAACVGMDAGPTPETSPARRGSLLVIGGGLDDDLGTVWRRFVELAARAGTPRFVIVTAATGPQDQEAIDKTEALRIWAPGAPVDVVLREATTDATVAAIDAATALFFTGGDQERITARYRPEDRDTPEWLAMQRLLDRGGVIAGASAGDAMMGAAMFTGGGSAAALGIGEPTPDRPLGPRLAPGMNFLPWATTDSHFFERDRIGRLVAGLLAARRRVGLGVGEDAAVEVDLATGCAVGLTGSESLLVDVATARRDSGSWLGLRARVLRQGERVNLIDYNQRPLPDLVPPPAGTPFLVPIAEPGQNRQLASWRLFRAASVPGAPAQELRLAGWRVVAWPAGDGEVAFALHTGT